MLSEFRRSRPRLYLLINTSLLVKYENFNVIQSELICLELIQLKDLFSKHSLT